MGRQRLVCISIAVISAIFLVLLGKVIRPGRTAGFIGKMIEKIGHGVQRVLSRLPHFWKEMYKFLITARGWIVICVVVFITIFICNNLQNKQGYYRKSRFLLFENPYIHLIKKLNHCIVTANAGKSPLRVNISNLLKAQVG